MNGTIKSLNVPAGSLVLTDGNGNEHPVTLDAQSVVNVDGSVVDAKSVNRFGTAKVGDSVSVSGTNVNIRA